MKSCGAILIQPRHLPIELCGDFAMKLTAWAGTSKNGSQATRITNLRPRDRPVQGLRLGAWYRPRIARWYDMVRVRRLSEDFADYAQRSYNAADAGKRRGFHADVMIIRYKGVNSDAVDWQAVAEQFPSAAGESVGCSAPTH